MGIGSITLTAGGTGAAPSTLLAATIPTPDSVRFSPSALMSFADIPELKGVLIANGIDPLRHVVTNVLTTGPLAPSAALTATPTSVRATAVITGTANFSDNDIFNLRDRPIGALPAAGFGSVTIQSALSAAPGGHEVLLGASLAATLANIQKLVQGTGIHGTDYMDYNMTAAAGATGDPWFPNHTDITSPAVTATTVAFRAGTYGVVGNGYVLTEVLDGAASWAVTTAWSGGAAGTGTTPEAGSYGYVYAHVRQEDGAQSGASPVANVTVDGNGNVNLSVLAASVDTDPDIKRWFRTKTGGVKYWRGYDIPEADTTDVDDVADADLDGRFGNVSYDPKIHRPYEAGYPPRGRYVARYKGRYWAYGAFIAADTPGTSTWTLTLTNGSRTVTVPGASVAYLTSAMNGRLLTETTAAGLGYRIVYVVESTQTLHLDREYEGTTGDKAVTIRDDRDPYELHYSEANRPGNGGVGVNNWPVGNTVRAVRSPSSIGGTGLFPIWESLIAFTPTGVHRITGDGPFAVHHDWEGPGCVSGHSVVQVDGILYWCGPDGFYEWDGSGAPRKISSPAVAPGGDVVGIDRTFARINMAHGHRIVAHYDPAEKVIRWYVPGELDLRQTPTGIEAYNRYAVVYDLRVAAFTIDTCEDVTAVASVFKGDAARVTLTGDIQGVVMHIDVGNSDGAFGNTATEITSGSCTTSSIAVATASPTWTSGMVGGPIWITDSSGNVSRQTVAAVPSTSSATTRRQMTALAAGVQVCTGGIVMDLENAWYHLGAPQEHKAKQRTTTYFDVQSSGQVFYGSAKDQGTATVRSGDTYIDLSLTDGERAIYVNRRGRHHKDRWLAIQAGFDVVLQGFRVEVSVKE